jgi:pyruvate dehydrogenase E2 component (dihydrolipoamide acetyltransferase)
MRRFARELGVPLAEVKRQRPQGPHHAGRRAGLRQGRDGRRRADRRAEGQGARARGAGSGGPSPACCPGRKVDFAEVRPIERKDLSRIKKISGANLHRNWVVIPHVTNHDDADITELEAFRVQLNKENEKSGVKVTMLAFLIKAAVAALKKFPEFNASLDGDSWC